MRPFEKRGNEQRADELTEAFLWSEKLTYDPANKTLGVDVTASGLVAGSDHAVHIHLGSCDSQGAVKYPLNGLVASPAGTAEATTVIQNVDQAPPASGWYINVHLGSSSQIEQMGSPPFISSPSSAATSASRFQHRPTAGGMAPSAASISWAKQSLHAVPCRFN